MTDGTLMTAMKMVNHKNRCAPALKQASSIKIGHYDRLAEASSSYQKLPQAGRSYQKLGLSNLTGYQKLGGASKS